MLNTDKNNITFNRVPEYKNISFIHLNKHLCLHKPRPSSSVSHECHAQSICCYYKLQKRM